MIVGHIDESLGRLMVIELNETIDATYNKDIWLQLLKLWTNLIKGNKSEILSPNDKAAKELFDDEFISVSSFSSAKSVFRKI